MKNDTKIQISAAILGVLITTALVAGSTYAFGGGKMGFGMMNGAGGPMKEAIINNDYSALGEDPKISEEDFSKMVKVHKLVEEGKMDEAIELKKTIDYSGMGMGMKRGWHKGGMMKMNSEKHEAVKAALDSGDYSAFIESLGENNPYSEIINAENFPRLVEAHNLMAQAKSIIEELGITRGMRMMK